MQPYLLDKLPPQDWDYAAQSALWEFLPTEQGRYICEAFALSHYAPLLFVDPDEPDARLKRLRFSVDRLIDAQFYEDGLVRPDEPNAESVIDMWRTIGFYGRELGYVICPEENLGMSEAADYVQKVLVKKQRDYGHENIRKFGRTGLIVRIQDKVARLENLLAKDDGEHPHNESIFDNVVDVMGYSAIGIMWERDSFLLKLKEN